MRTPKPLLLSCTPPPLTWRNACREVNCCCQRCLATGEVGKEGEKGRRGVAVGLDKQVPTASWEGAVTWKRSIYLKKKKWRKSRECFNKRKQGIMSQFWLQRTFCQDILLFYLVCFSQTNISKDLYKGRNIFVCETLLWPQMDPPSPNIWLKHRSTMSVKGKLLHFSEKLLTEFHCQCREVSEPFANIISPESK